MNTAKVCVFNSLNTVWATGASALGVPLSA